MERNYAIIDVFTSEAGGGNPAAVVLDADGLADTRMQAIAAEFNLSETTFVLPASREGCAQSSYSDDNAVPRVRFRWFTPTVEVAMCGHATIAGVRALTEAGRLPLSVADCASIEIETRSGLLSSHVESLPGGSEWMIWLDLVEPTLTEQALPAAELTEALGLAPDALDRSVPSLRTQDEDLLLFVRDEERLTGAKPDFPRLGAVLERSGLRGLSLATVNTLSPSIDVQSRFFAPAVGVDEDPVTGSVHGPLAAYIVQRGGVPLRDGFASLTCAQGIPGGRTGLVHVRVQPRGDGGMDVRIGGRTVTIETGTLQP